MAATLLLADDNVTMQRVVELTFAREGIRVITAADGAVATARLEDDRPDIVLVDVGLPGVDGYQFAERVKGSSDLAAVPVLLLTGAFDPVDETRARAAGCDGIVVKPFEPQQLVDLVLRLLGGERPGTLWPEQVHVPEDEVVLLGDATAEVHEFALDGLDDLDQSLARQEPVEVAPLTPVEWDTPVAAPVAVPLETPEPRATSLADAFAALLAAEQSQRDSGLPPRVETFPREVVEDVVRRVVARMTDEVVRNLVMETADRLIREELDRLQQ